MEIYERLILIITIIHIRLSFMFIMSSHHIMAISLQRCMQLILTESVISHSSVYFWIAASVGHFVHVRYQSIQLNQYIYNIITILLTYSQISVKIRN